LDSAILGRISRRSSPLFFAASAYAFAVLIFDCHQSGAVRSHHLNQRFPWRKHFADLYCGYTGALQSIEQRSGIGAGHREQIYVGASTFILPDTTADRGYSSREQARDFHLLSPCRTGSYG
jgi:hypothetical protein